MIGIKTTMDKVAININNNTHHLIIGKVQWEEVLIVIIITPEETQDTKQIEHTFQMGVVTHHSICSLPRGRLGLRNNNLTITIVTNHKEEISIIIQ